MSKAKSRPTGLGMVSEGKELSKEELPPVEEENVKIYPMVRIVYAKNRLCNGFLIFFFFF